MAASDESRSPNPARVVAALSSVPHARFLGIRCDEIGPGRAILSMPYQNRLIGNYTAAVVHGGVITALLETEVSVVPKIINPSVDFFRAVRGEDAFARGTIIRQGRHVANVRAEAWQDDPQKPVAAAHAHFLLK